MMDEEYINREISDTSKHYYLRNLEYDKQKMITTFRQASTATITSCCWTHRSTGCDVLSVITTIHPSPSTAMKDIRFNMFNKDVHRIKPVSEKINTKSRIQRESESEYGILSDFDKGRKVISQMLKEEKDNFMGKLHYSRVVRTQTEKRAATLIQTIYRGYRIRRDFEYITIQNEYTKDMRVQVLEYLFNHGIATSYGSHREKYIDIRKQAAIIVQCAFRSYLSRQYFRRKQFQRQQRHISDSITRIQSIVRMHLARQCVGLLRYKIEATRQLRAALLMQRHARMFVQLCKYRKMVKQKKERAIITIQNWMRKVLAIKRVNSMRKLRLERRVVSLQSYVRCYLAIMRVYKLKLRKLHVIIYQYAVKIQSWLRVFLAKSSVKKFKIDKHKKAITNVSQMMRNASIKSVVTDFDKSLIMDAGMGVADDGTIFSYSQYGQLDKLLDIYHGDSHVVTIHDIDENGDNILTIASRNGQVEIARKCLINWKFDPNYRNHDDKSSLILAVENNHLHIIQFFLSYNRILATDKINLYTITPSDSSYMLVKAIENQNQSILRVLLEQSEICRNINVPCKETGAPAIMRACEIGNRDIIMVLLRCSPDINGRDRNGQTILHKLSQTSCLDLLKDVLEKKKYCSKFDKSQLFEVDIDNKNCLILACLAGKCDVVQYIMKIQLELYPPPSIVPMSEEDSQTVTNDTNQPNESSNTMESPDVSRVDENVEDGSSSLMTMENEPSVMLTAIDTSRKLNITWSLHDLNSIHQLIQNDNIICFLPLIDAGLDPNILETTTNKTFLMIACRYGSLQILDFLMALEDKLTSCLFVDMEDNNILHYAANCTNQDIITYLLQHRLGKYYKIREVMLTKMNHNRDTPLHVAIHNNTYFPLDSISTKIREYVVDISNNQGLTPMLLACSFARYEWIAQLITCKADAGVFDRYGNSCLWIFSHYLCQSHEDKMLYNSDDAEKITTTIISLIQAGCPLFHYTAITVPKLLELSDNYDLFRLDAGDIIVSQGYCEVLERIAGHLNYIDCWRLVLSCILFSNGSSKKLLSVLYSDNVLNILWNQYTCIILPEPPVDDLNSVSSDTSSTTQSTIAFLLDRLQVATFAGSTILGWMIKLKQAALLNEMLEFGFNIALPVDNTGNLAIHVACMHDIHEVTDVMLQHDINLLGNKDRKGLTPAIVCAKYNSAKAYKVLVKYNVNLWEGLSQRYCSWMIVYIRKAGKLESDFDQLLENFANRFLPL